MSNCLTHSLEFEAKLPMKAISGRMTIQQIAADHAIYQLRGIQRVMTGIDIRSLEHPRRVN